MDLKNNSPAKFIIGLRNVIKIIPKKTLLTTEREHKIRRREY
jgi:hypothetical protein